MRIRNAALALVFAICACSFNPDLSGYPECVDGSCPDGFTCWSNKNRCIPICGEEPDCDANTFVSQPDSGQHDAGDSGAPDAGDGGALDGGDAGPLTLDAGAPLRGVETLPYSWPFEVTGGAPPYSFRIDDGGLPSGVDLNFSGVLTGTPQVDQSVSFVLRVQDTLNAVVSAPVEWTIRPLLRIGTKQALTDGIANQAYDEALYATGGVPPYTWTLDGGSLPSGLQLTTTDGHLTGNAGAAATWNFVARVTDSDIPPQSVARLLTLQVKSAPITLTWLTNSLADGRHDTAYSQLLKASGSSPLSYSVVSGELPPGVTLSAANGTLTGTALDAGTYNVTLKVSDGTLQSQQASFQITLF